MIPSFLIVLAAGYLLGALPFGYVVAKAKGVNIFEVGSKNPGATNVRRVLGKGPGNLVFALDALKGVVAAAWPLFAPLGAIGEPVATLQVAGLIGALLGHSFSCFTRFKGGKGVATGAGGFLVLVPVPTLIAAVVWVATFYGTRYVSLASILAACTIPVAAFFMGYPLVITGVAVAVAVFVVVRHRANLVRLVQGTENKFVKKSAEKNDSTPNGR